MWGHGESIWFEFLKLNFGEILSTDGAQTAIKNATAATIKELTDRQDKLENQQQSTSKEVEKLQIQNRGLAMKLDKMDQNQRNNTIRITGVMETENEGTSTAALVLALFKDKLKLDIKKEALLECFRIPHKDRNVSDPKPIVIKFNDLAAKKSVYRARIKLKDDSSAKVFINEDLTMPRANLAYQARAAVKAKKIHSTWSMDGDIFIKKKASDRPQKVLFPSDLTENSDENKVDVQRPSTSQDNHYAF